MGMCSKFHRQAYHGGDETELAATATRAPRRLIARAVLPLLRFRPAIPFTLPTRYVDGLGPY